MKKKPGILFLPVKPATKHIAMQDEHINILFKDGEIKDISEVDNALINQTLFGTVKKFYICFPNVE